MALLPPTVAELTANTDEFMAKMAEAKAAMADVADSGGGAMAGLASQGKVLATALGTALVAVGGIALDLGAKYQSATDSLAASAGISIKAATDIGNAFLSTGGKTIYSAQQMMEAYQPVAAQLGLLEGHALSASQALAFMSTAGDLAEASGTSLADATSDLAAVMQAYQLKLGDANMASNVLFNTSRLTGQSLDSLTKIIQRLHSTLGDLTPPLSQVGGLMVDLTAHGETGRQAISGVNTAMTTLLGSFKAGQTTVSSTTIEIDQLGLSVFNQQGKFVGLGDIITQLHDKFADMNQEQQILAATNLFGAGAAAKMLEVIDAGPAAFDRYTAEVDKTNSAHEAAEKQLQSFEDRLKIVEADVEDAAVKLGEWLIPKVEDLTHDLRVGATWIDHHREALLALTPVAIYAGVAMSAAAINGVQKLTTSFAEGVQTIGNFGAKILGLEAPFAATQSDAEVMQATLTEATTSMQAAMAELTEAISANTAAIVGDLQEIGTQAQATAAEVDAAAGEMQAGMGEAGAAGALGEGEAAAGAGLGEAGAGALGGIGLAGGAILGGGALLGGALLDFALSGKPDNNGLSAAQRQSLGMLANANAGDGMTYQYGRFGNQQEQGYGASVSQQDTFLSQIAANIAAIKGEGAKDATVAGVRAAVAASTIASHPSTLGSGGVLKVADDATKTIASLGAKDRTIGQLEQNVVQMGQLFGKGSPEQIAALQALRSQVMQWFPQLSKDTTVKSQLSAIDAKQESLLGQITNAREQIPNLQAAIKTVSGGKSLSDLEEDEKRLQSMLQDPPKGADVKALHSDLAGVQAKISDVKSDTAQLRQLQSLVSNDEKQGQQLEALKDGLDGDLKNLQTDMNNAATKSDDGLRNVVDAVKSPRKMTASGSVRMAFS